MTMVVSIHPWPGTLDSSPATKAAPAILQRTNPHQGVCRPAALLSFQDGNRFHILTNCVQVARTGVWCLHLCVCPPPALAPAPEMLLGKEGWRTPASFRVLGALGDVSRSWRLPVNICSPYSDPGIPFRKSHGLIWQRVPRPIMVWGRDSILSWLAPLPQPCLFNPRSAQAPPTKPSKVMNILAAFCMLPVSFTLCSLS